LDRSWVVAGGRYVHAGRVGLGTWAVGFLSGYLVDRFFAPYIAAFSSCWAPSRIGLITSGAGGPVPTFGNRPVGKSLPGTEIDMLGFLSSRYFGLRHFGQLYGLYLLRSFRRERRLALCVGCVLRLVGSYNDALFGYVVCLSSRAVDRLAGAYVFPVETTLT